MFEFSVGKDMKNKNNKDKKRSPTYLLKLSVHKL